MEEEIRIADEALTLNTVFNQKIIDMLQKYKDSANMLSPKELARIDKLDKRLAGVSKLLDKAKCTLSEIKNSLHQENN